MPQTSATVNLHDMLADINCSDIQLSSLSVHRHNYAEQHHHLGQQYSKFKKINRDRNHAMCFAEFKSRHFAAC